MLTGMYVLILGSVLLISGGVTRTIFINQVETRFVRFENYVKDQRPFFVETIDFSPTPLNQRALRTDFEESIILVNGILLVVGGLLSYWFAGVTLRPIERAYEKQRRFVADASHELRTPLTILKLRLEERALTTDAEPLRMDIYEDVEEIDGMTRMVNDLLEMAKMQDHLREKKQVLIDAREVAERTVERMRQMATRASVTLSYETSEQNLIPVAARSAESLERAVANIVKNAISHNDKGGVVKVVVSVQKEQVQIAVQDNGPGIPDKEKESIFERFYRVDKSRSKRVPGTGLGLPIAQEIVTDIGGRVKVEDAPEKGTIVSIFLPIHKAS